MGHIQKRTRNGKTRYYARYNGPDGKEYSKSFLRRGKVDEPGTAAHWLSEQETAMRELAWTDPKSQGMTLNEWATKWLSTRTGIARSTKTEYTLVVTGIRDSGLGDIPLKKLTKLRLEEWVSDLVNNRHWSDRGNLSDSTATKDRHILSTILASAVDNGLMPRNPIKGVRPPMRKVDEDEPIDPADLPTANDVWRLYECGYDIFREMIIVAAGTGLRRGELLGNRLKHIHPTELHVVEQLVLSEPTRTFGPLKTPKARRRVPFGQEVADAIDRHLAAFPTDNINDPLFRDPKGLPWRRTTFQWRWDRIRTAAGLPGLRFHYLRHFYASTLIAGGANVKVVMERMGHANPQETLNTYARLWPDSEETTRNITDFALRRGTDGANPDP